MHWYGCGPACFLLDPERRNERSRHALWSNRQRQQSESTNQARSSATPTSRASSPPTLSPCSGPLQARITSLGTLSGGSSSAAFEINSAGEIAGDSFLSSGDRQRHQLDQQEDQEPRRFVQGHFHCRTRHQRQWRYRRRIRLRLRSSVHFARLSLERFHDEGSRHSPGRRDQHGQRHQCLGSHRRPIRRNRAPGVTGTPCCGTRRTRFRIWACYPAATTALPSAVNDSNVVVGYGNLWNNAAHAMVWTSTGGMQDLNSLIPAELRLGAHQCQRDQQLWPNHRLRHEGRRQPLLSPDSGELNRLNRGMGVLEISTLFRWGLPFGAYR